MSGIQIGSIVTNFGNCISNLRSETKHSIHQCSHCGLILLSWFYGAFKLSARFSEKEMRIHRGLRWVTVGKSMGM